MIIKNDLTWQFQRKKSFRAREVDFMQRSRLENEWYVNGMLTGISEIIERNGGTCLLSYPIPPNFNNIGKDGEKIAFYCDGITLESGYDCGLNRGGKRISQESFWTRVYTPKKTWKSAPVIQDLKKFFQIRDLSEATALARLLFPSSVK